MGGADKALLRLHGRPLVDHAAARIGPQVERLAVSANGDAARIGGLVLPDAGGSHGPLSGVLAGLIWAGDAGADALVTAPVDAPFLPGDLVPMLCLHWPDAAMAEAGGRAHPTCALWPVAARAAVEDALAAGDLRLGDALRRIGARAVRFPDARAFVNVNTPDDLAEAEAMP